MLAVKTREQGCYEAEARETMKAIVCPQYGSPDVLRYEQVQKPVPADGEVRVKIHAASLNAGDWHLMRADPCLVRLAYGLFRPWYKIPGTDIAGRVEAVGENVTGLKVGDEVYGDLSECGFGAFAEYTAVPESALALKPEGMRFEQAAAIPSAAVTALQGLRDKGRVQAGQKVLINGASGGVGTYAVQLAKAFGAEVTAVCSTTKVEMVRELGADYVIDYTKKDFTQNGKRYDLIFAVNGYRSLSDYEQALTPRGIYITSGGTMAQLFEAMLLGPWKSRKKGKTFANFLVKPNKQDLLFLKGLVEDGRLQPVIDRQYTLQEVPEALTYLEAGHARGKVVITLDSL